MKTGRTRVRAEVPMKTLISIDRQLLDIYSTIIWTVISTIAVLTVKPVITLVVMVVVALVILYTRRALVRERPSHKRIR